MFIYTESYAESHRNTQNINIYHKHTKNTKIHFRFSHFFKDAYFHQKDIQKYKRSILNSMEPLFFDPPAAPRTRV